MCLIWKNKRSESVTFLNFPLSSKESETDKHVLFTSLLRIIDNLGYQEEHFENI